MKPLLLRNIGQLVTMRGSPRPRRGSALADIGLVSNAAVLLSGGKIVTAGSEPEILREPWLKKHRKRVREFDCRGCVVTPGFVDSHTHLIFAGPRLIDFEKRISGATYEEIAASGGGIRSSLDALRKTSRAKLADGASDAMQQMLAHGTTTVEAKSGYGLSFAAEIKSLEAIRAAAKTFPGTVVPTFLGAHVVPPEFKSEPDAYVREVCEHMLPEVARRKLAQFVDVFCERGAFTLEQTERIFAQARKLGLGTRAHVGQFSATELKALLAYEPASFDHLDVVNLADLALLARSNTVATLVPGANYFLDTARYPDARAFIAAGVAVALATDFNPGTSPMLSMQFVLSLACTHLKMSPAEALSAATINGAHALRLAETKGSIESGKDADLAMFAVKDYRELAYWFGSNSCSGVIVNGEVIQPAC